MEAYKPECMVPTLKRGKFCDGLGSNIVVQYSVGLIITLHVQITARKYVDRFGKSYDSDVISKMTMPPFTQLELFSYGLKSMKVNCSIFPGQHNFQI
jgi:hypothetical protein